VGRKPLWSLTGVLQVPYRLLPAIFLLFFPIHPRKPNKFCRRLFGAGVKFATDIKVALDWTGGHAT